MCPFLGPAMLWGGASEFPRSCASSWTVFCLSFPRWGSGALGRVPDCAPSLAFCGRVTGSVYPMTGLRFADSHCSPTGGFGLPSLGSLGRCFAASGVLLDTFLGVVCSPLRGLDFMTGNAASYACSAAFRRALRSCFVAGSCRGVLLSHPSRKVSFWVRKASDHSARRSSLLDEGSSLYCILEIGMLFFRPF